MRINATSFAALVAAGLLTAGLISAESKKPRMINGKQLGLGNELINFDEFSKSAQEAGKHRSARRVTEDQFLKMAEDENTIILDTRSAKKFSMLHVKGAVHLNFSDITKGSLAKTIPNKDTRILIYCNNNFDQEPVAFESKAPSMALNIPTFITLYSYGYQNIYELGPLLDVNKTRITLEGNKQAQEQETNPKSKLTKLIR